MSYFQNVPEIFEWLDGLHYQTFHVFPNNHMCIKSSPPGQNGHHFADIFKCIFMNQKFCISIRISLKFVHKGPIDNIPPRHQAIIWTNADPIHQPIYAALGGDELSQHQVRWWLGAIMKPTKTNVDKDSSCHIVTLDLNELKFSGPYNYKISWDDITF